MELITKVVSIIVLKPREYRKVVLQAGKQGFV